MIIPPNYTLFAGEEYHINEAKEYIARHNLSADTVKLLKRHGGLEIITKKEIELCEKKS